MITRKQIPIWTASDGSEHASLAEAQAADLRVLLSDALADEMCGTMEASAVVTAQALNVVINGMVTHAAKVVDVLTTKENSLVKARAVNGGTKRRKPKAENRVAALEPLNGAAASTKETP